MEKRIETVELSVSELVDNLGNPRKITTKKRKELQESLEEFGDFGVIVIDENNDILSGHQRVEALKVIKGDDAKVWCKRLIGYTEPEKRAINIKCNTHAGEWDLSKLAEWTADLTVKVGLDLPQVNHDDIKNRNMELIRYEKYDYVMIVCRNEIDYLNLIRSMGLEDKKVLVSHTKQGDRKIKARAVWSDDYDIDIKPKK